MPNIPNVPGVPPLLSYSLSPLILLTRDVLRVLFGAFFSQWGIFQNGLPVIAADNYVSFDFRQDWPMSNYPTEEGGFQNYNKVETPAEIRIRVSCGGSDARRQTFLDSIKAVVATTDLFDVVTPEEIFIGYCFDHIDYRRSAVNGVGLIVVDLWMKEVRESAAATTFQDTQQPGIAGRQSIGNVQPQEPTNLFAGTGTVPTLF